MIDDVTAFPCVQKAEAEVKRLDELKASKTKEVFLKKQKELEDTCNRSHMETPSTEIRNITNLVDSGGTNDCNFFCDSLHYICHVKLNCRVCF